MSGRHFEVKAPLCTACGACSSLAPAVFTLQGKASVVARQPCVKEVQLCEAALLVCPAHAIKASTVEQPNDPAEAPAGEVYTSLIRESEAVRWSLSEVRWDELNPTAATPALRALVREMAFSEYTTYSATSRFMQAFYNDVDLTQWISVWFYEETRHPHALLSWLRRLGVEVDDGFALKGRVSTPFMKSLTGTLVTNIISEMTAATAYHRLSMKRLEPVFSFLSEHIAGDEARHAAAFFRYALRRISTSQDLQRERLDALKVLHVWLNNNDNVTHPINQMLQRLERGEEEKKLLDDFDLAGVRTRVTRLVGVLIDVPLRQPDEVPPLLKEMVTAVQGEART